MRWRKISPKKFATLKLLLGQDVKQLSKYENKKQLTNDFNDLYLKWKPIIASISTAIAPEILKAQVNSMSSFAELSISQFKLLILASSNSTSPLDIIPTHVVKSFPDYFFLDLLKLLNLSLKAGCFSQSLKWPLLNPARRKQFMMEIFKLSTYLKPKLRFKSIRTGGFYAIALTPWV